jgi:hypothetical protein
MFSVGLSREGFTRLGRFGLLGGQYLLPVCVCNLALETELGFGRSPFASGVSFEFVWNGWGLDRLCGDADPRGTRRE